jgi:O-antigen/teichoic acid export membrane protein
MSVRRALFFSYLEKYGSYVLALGSTVVLSRLLSPADVGAFSIGMALVGMVAVFREFGVSTYLAQETELTDDRVAAAFTLTVGMGLALALLVAALAVPVAAFYGDVRLQLILFILALNFALSPLGSVSQSLLTRDLQFGVLAWVRLAYGTVSAAVSITQAAEPGMGCAVRHRGHGGHVVRGTPAQNDVQPSPQRPSARLRRWAAGDLGGHRRRPDQHRA